MNQMSSRNLNFSLALAGLAPEHSYTLSNELLVWVLGDDRRILGKNLSGKRMIWEKLTKIR